MRSDQQPKSRYRIGGKSEIVNDDTIRWWERFDFKESQDDLVIKLENKYNTRPDLLSNDVYNSPHLAWLILQYNNIVDINEEFITEKVIKLPLPSRVNKEFMVKK